MPEYVKPETLEYVAIMYIRSIYAEYADKKAHKDKKQITRDAVF